MSVLFSLSIHLVQKGTLTSMKSLLYLLQEKTKTVAHILSVVNT